MEHLQVVYSIILIATGILSILLSFYVLINSKGGQGTKPFFWVIFTSVIYSFGYAFELTSTTVEEIKFWLKIEYLGAPFIPVFILIMCIEYAGYRSYLDKRILFFLFFIPITTMILVHTNDFHHLFYESVGLREDAPFTMVELVKGKWYLFYMGYTMACFILSISILFVKLRRASYPYNMQIISLLLGIFIPVVGIFIYQTGGSPFGIDIGPLLSSISYLFFGLAFISFKMINVGPIAKDKVFDSMQDGVIVLNHLNRMVDYNLAATKVIPTLDHNSIGRNIDDLIVSLPHFQNHLHLFHSSEVTEEFSIEEGGSLFHYQIKFSPVMDNDKKEIGHIFQFIDITEKVIIQNELKRLATIDGLTNIANRTYFLEMCELYIKKAKDKEVNVSLVMFDIDHFKSINDTYGHSAGDKVIQYVVNKANLFLGDEDIIGRYGGEEFMLFLPNTNHRQSVELAENIKREIENGHVPVDNKKITVTCSLGITTSLLNKQTPIPLTLLIKNADEALYCAKKNGRNRVEHYNFGEWNKAKSFQ